MLLQYIQLLATHFILLRLIYLQSPYSLILLIPLQTLSLVGTIVAKGKGRASFKPSSALALHAESSKSATANPAPALIRSTKQVEELSDKELSNKKQVSSKQLKALCEQVAD